MTPDDLARAIQSLKKAIELDPNYGRAYAELALAYWMGAYLPGVMKGLGFPWVRPVAGRAIS